MKTFTLVPVGGFGNRILAISSALIYCQAKNIHLEILWFKDPGLNCDYDLLFSLKKALDQVEIRNAKGLDFVLRDNPRKKNFWIPRLFEKVLFDKCIYYYDEDYEPENVDPRLDPSLDSFQHIFMVSCREYWKSMDMYNWLSFHPTIEDRVKSVFDKMGSHVVGVHIRRTDNWVTLAYAPTDMFVDAMKKELENDPEVCFYLASDSLDEKKYLMNLFGNQLVTSMKETSRNTIDGIIDALVDMIILSRTQKMYAGQSSFAFIASKISGGVECVWIDTRLAKSEEESQYKENLRFTGM